MKNRADIARTLAQMSAPQLSAACSRLLNTVPASKGGAMTMLMGAIDNGTVTLDQITGQISGTQYAPRPAAPARPAAAPAPSTAQIDAASAAAARAEQAAIDVSTRLDTLDGVLTGVKLDASAMKGEIKGITGAVAQVADQVTTLAREVRRVGDIKADPATVAAAVTAAVAEAFGPIRAAAESNGTVAEVQAAAAALPERKSVQDVFGIDLRDLKGQPLMVDVYTDPDAPAIDAHYIWTEAILRPLVVASMSGQPLWFGGEKGTGKTAAAMQWAARTGRAFTRILFSKYITTEHYLGATGLEAGNTGFVPGPLLTGISKPGSVVLLDELTALDPGEGMPMNGLLERGQGRVNVGGKTWVKAPGAMIIAADNTLGNGDASGRYAGTRAMNPALLDRFALIVPVTFLPAAEEAAALARLTGCDPALADEVIAVLNACRAKAKTGDLVDPPSLRQATAWVESMPVLGCRAAWEVTVASHQPAESDVAMQAIYAAHVDESRLESLT